MNLNLDFILEFWRILYEDSKLTCVLNTDSSLNLKSQWQNTLPSGVCEEFCNIM